MPIDLTPHAAAPPLDRPDSACVDTVLPSPNHGERRDGRAPDSLVLHYTGMADGPSAIRWLCTPESEVSCHYVVEEDGRVLQLVAEQRRAWHAGRSSWAGETDMNSASIGVEIVNAGHPGGLPPYPDRQVEAVIALCSDIVARYGLAAERVLAHSDIAPGRKLDPGERFPWRRLAEAGVGLWVAPQLAGSGSGLHPGARGPSVTDLQEALRSYGYGIEPTGRYDTATETVVRAFQLHFRPDRVDGLADPETLATSQALLAARAELIAARVRA
jgi:N-acetylmuramoyl-L-alanine amidase